jgi:predicted dehydrogenase
MAKKWCWMGISMSEKGSLRFGIVGCGSASLPVCEAIVASSLTELAMVYDVNHVLAEDLSQRFQVPKMESFEELLTSPNVDVVYVAVPHHLLASLTKRVLEANKHVLTEKPLAISLEEIDQLIDMAARHQLALGVYYEMRYAPAHSRARELIQAGAIGNIIGVQIQTLIDKSLAYWQVGYSNRSLNPWRSIKAQAGGGVVLMNTSHLLDALFHMTGLVVTSVSAQVDHLVADIEVEDTASAILRFDNGAIGSLIAGAHIKGAHHDECCFLYGTEGQIRLPDPYGNEPLQIYLKRPLGNLAPDQWHSIPLNPVPVHQYAIEDFAQAVQSKRGVPIDAQSAQRVLSVVLAIYQAAVEKRTINISYKRGNDARN